MSAEYGIELFSTLEKALRDTQDPNDAERADHLVVMLKARGKGLIYHPRTAAEVVSAVAEQTTSVPDLFSKRYPEIPLSEEHQRQGVILAGRYAARLGFESAEAYIATFPQFPERPASYSDLGLNIPILVEKRIPWMEAAELSGIFVTDYLKSRTREVSDWKDDKFEMPQGPFSAWAQDGTKFVNRKPSDVRKELLSKKENRDYRAGRILDSIALWNVRPDMVKSMYWDVVGTRVGSGGVPCLRHWDGGPRLGAFHGGFALPDFRALVLGREIRTLELAA